MDFPFVHTAAYDNNDYYLRRAWDKSSRFLGCIFADFRTKFGPIGTLSRNLVLYGHNVDDNRESGEMFAQLLRYDDPEWYNEHPYIEVSTENDDMVWVIFAAFYTDINFDYIEPNPDDKTFMYIVDEAIKRSELETNVDVKLTDNILTLSTCTLKYGTRTDQRFVVMARLQRKGENLQELNPTATKNPNPKAPQF